MRSTPLARGPASWASLVPACECVNEALGLVVAVEAERRNKLFDLGRRLGRLRGEDEEGEARAARARATDRTRLANTEKGRKDRRGDRRAAETAAVLG